MARPSIAGRATALHDDGATLRPPYRSAVTGAKAATDHMGFAQAGPLIVSSSPLWISNYSSRLTTIIATLGTVGTTDTTVLIYVGDPDGTPTLAATIVLGNGVRRVDATPNVGFVRGVDYIWCEVTGVGTDAQNLSVLLFCD